MMDLDSAIQHCKEQVQEQAKRGCYSCAEEHQQLAEWLKELKAYREQRGERMNEAEKERLIKKDIASIENRVRHAFNQGYEMGVKESRSEIPNKCGDAISRQAVLDIAKSSKSNWIDNSVLFKRVNELPPVTPQQKMGHWFAWKPEDDAWRTTCSECGEETRTLWNYCPYCGAKMEVKE
jgi:sugar-specific transcriptional regulator TrmB